MSKTTEWSLSQRLKSRIIVISAIILIFVSASVTVHYGYDIPALEKRVIFDVANQVAEDLPLDETGEKLRQNVNAQHDYFVKFPEAYEWYVLDGSGNLLGYSAINPIPRADLPPGLPPPEWDSRSPRGGWMGGRTIDVEGTVRHIVVVAHTDPAGMLAWLAAGEALMHVVLPLGPFFILIWIFVSRIVKRTLQPLQSLAEQAERVQRMEDIRPLDPKDAPLEVAELVKALNFSLEKLRASIEAEKQFLQDAAHALRTPLAIVKARLELDGDKVDKDSLLEEVDGLIRLATQLLASANAERLVLRADARADLSALARDAVSNMTPLAIRTGVDLGYEDDGRTTVVRGDSDAISHALKNLIENALKYTPRGRTVTVQVSHDPPTIIVQDEGPGIPVGKDEQIFARHSRGKFGDGKGAGLGLSIVRRIMTAHGGDANLLRNEQPGAAFRLTFPPVAVDTPSRTANDDTASASLRAA